MLNELRCEACNSDAVALNKEEQRLLLTELNDWQLIERDGITQLSLIHI